MSMNTASLIRGVDGRLFAVSAEGVTEVSEKTAVKTEATRAGKEFKDLEAGRYAVSPGL